MAPPKEKFASTPEAYRELSSKEGVSILYDLNNTEQAASTSNWTLRHIIAYRLLGSPRACFLEPREEHHRSFCAHCKRSESQALNRVRASDPIREISKEELHGSERNLLNRPGGSFWVSLAGASYHSSSVDEVPSNPDNASNISDNSSRASTKRHSRCANPPAFRNTFEETSPGLNSLSSCESPHLETSHIDENNSCARSPNTRSSNTRYQWNHKNYVRRRSSRKTEEQAIFFAFIAMAGFWFQVHSQAVRKPGKTDRTRQTLFGIA